METRVEVWTRLIPDPYEKGALRADLPPHVGADVEVVQDRLQPGAPLATTYVSALIDPKHLPDCKQILDPSVVPERDKLLVAMSRTPRAQWEVFFNSLDMTGASQQRKRNVKDTLLQAVARGMAPDTAERIRARLGLPKETADDGR